ncbi:MAG TPA: hypothetical protein VKY85_26510 [Candidatus Angelobacter sp.]|nr:hypothetical protein [Candidatus Angelobacter sp.]
MSLYYVILNNTPINKARIAATVVAAVVVAACFWMAQEYGGWVALGLFLPYLGMWGIHVYAHWRAARHVTRKILILVAASNFFLLTGFLLQWDVGDGDIGWLTITALLENGAGSSSPAPAWWPQTLTMNLTVFIPEVLSLAALFWLTRRAE